MQRGYRQGVHPAELHSADSQRDISEPQTLHLVLPIKARASSDRRSSSTGNFSSRQAASTSHVNGTGVADISRGNTPLETSRPAQVAAGIPHMAATMTTPATFSPLSPSALQGAVANNLSMLTPPHLLPLQHPWLQPEGAQPQYTNAQHQMPQYQFVVREWYGQPYVFTVPIYRPMPAFQPIASPWTEATSTSTATESTRGAAAQEGAAMAAAQLRPAADRGAGEALRDANREGNMDSIKLLLKLVAFVYILGQVGMNS